MLLFLIHFLAIFFKNYAQIRFSCLGTICNCFVRDSQYACNYKAMSNFVIIVMLNVCILGCAPCYHQHNTAYSVNTTRLEWRNIKSCQLGGRNLSSSTCTDDADPKKRVRWKPCKKLKFQNNVYWMMYMCYAAWMCLHCNKINLIRSAHSCTKLIVLLYLCNRNGEFIWLFCHEF